MPRYDRQGDALAEHNDQHVPSEDSVDDAALEDAAAALRKVEVEAAQPEPEISGDSSFDVYRLESMNIDKLRVVAKELDVPERATITDKDDLIAAIRQRL
jgi:hypothetical protein